MPVRVKKTRQNKRLEPGLDSIRTDKALGFCYWNPVADAFKTASKSFEGEKLKGPAERRWL
jgi:hypothetical protein